jgi:membrane-bound lytic murein transglycosylase B
LSGGDVKQTFCYPQMVTRRTVLRTASMLALTTSTARAQPAESFDHFFTQLRTDAAARGVTAATFAAAFGGVTPDPAVMAAMRREPEYGKPMPAYLASLVSPTRIAAGQRKLTQWADTLRAVQQRFGVDPAILVSIWGVESGFGEAPGSWDVFRSLATLAAARFQHPLFRNELISALVILQQGKIPRGRFAGSWAGAMGQPQFLPSSYLSYAVDFDGDGRADIWSSVPDVLGSIANYLQKFGWRAGLPWGFEVVVPQKFDFRESRGSLRHWAELGFRRADGGVLPAEGAAILFFPSGASGPAFLVTDNFVVIKTFNNSDAYALAVGTLSDRLRGAGPIRAAWPADDYQPSRDTRIALQRRLAALGFKVADLQGHLDFEVRDQVRELQRRFGMTADGYPSRSFLQRLGVPAR